MVKNVSDFTKKHYIRRAIRFFLSVIIFLSIGFIILNYLPFISDFDNYAIVTDSMDPVIKVGDMATINTSVDPSTLEPGDIIAFTGDINNDGKEEVIVHYLYSATEIEGEMIYKTYSEVRVGLVDPWELTDDDIIGVHVLTIPKIGPIFLFSQSTIGRIVLILDIVIFYVILELIGSDRRDRKKRLEQKKELQNEELQKKELEWAKEQI